MTVVAEDPGPPPSYPTFAACQSAEEFGCVVADNGFADGTEWGVNLLQMHGEDHLGTKLEHCCGFEVERNLDYQAAGIAAVVGTLDGWDTEHLAEHQN